MNVENLLETAITNLNFDKLMSIPGGAAPLLTSHKDRTLTNLEKHLDAPVRIRQELGFDDVRGFVEYVKAFSSPATVVFASPGGVTAIFDYHQPDKPSWATHRAFYNLQLTPEWRAWAGMAGRSMDQRAFAEFLDENRESIKAPSGSELLTAVRQMRATVTSKIASLVQDDGINATFDFKKDVEVKAGNQVELPKALTVVLKPYDGLDDLPGGQIAYELEARISYALDEENKRIAFSYAIQNFERAKKRAFDGIVKAIGDAIGDVAS